MVKTMADADELITEEINPPCPRCNDGPLRPAIVVTAETLIFGDICFKCNYFQSYQQDSSWMDRWILSAGKELQKGAITDEEMHLLLEFRKRGPNRN